MIVLTMVQLKANAHLVVARPWRSGWSLLLNQLAGFIRVFQEDIDVRGEVSSNYLGLGFCVSQRCLSLPNGRAVQFSIGPLSTRRCVDTMVTSGYYMSTGDEE